MQSKRLLALALAALTVTGTARADYLLLVDPTRLDAAAAVTGPGLDGRQIRPRSVAAACVSDGVLGPGAFSPRRSRCRAVAGVPGLADAIADLQVNGVVPAATVSEVVAAGGIVAVESVRRIACIPGSCARELFDDASYPENLVGRAPPTLPPVPVINAFGVAPEMLTAGESAELSWSATGVPRCEILETQSQQRITVPATGSRTVQPRTDTVWTLRCDAPGSRAEEQVAVTVLPPPLAPEIVLFAPTRDLVPPGGSARLVWETRRAERCGLDDGTGPVQVRVNARQVVTVDADTRFLLRCENAAGDATARASVLVAGDAAPPMIEAFEVSPSPIARGEYVVARWFATEDARCRLRDLRAQIDWSVPNPGRVRLAPPETTTYELVCRNFAGVARDTMVLTVNPSGEPLRVNAFDASPLGVLGKGGQSPRLSEPGLVRVAWTTTGARSCRLSDDAGRSAPAPTAGDEIVRLDDTTTFRLDCSSTTGQAQALSQADVLGEAVFFGDFE